MDITNIEALCLTKLSGPKGERPAPGMYEVDFEVAVKGSVSVGDDTTKKPTVSIPMKEVLALFIQRSGVTREASVKLLREAMIEALKQDTKGTGAIAAATDIEQVSKDIVSEVVASLPRTPVLGRVTTNLEVEKISD